MRISRLQVVIAMALLAFGIPSKLGANDEKTPNEEQRAQAINVVRLINTAEAMYSLGTSKNAGDGHGQYTSWEELYRSGVVKTAQDRWSIVRSLQVSTSPEVIPGYRLDLIVAPDGKTFSVALHDTMPADGMFTVFSDQTGIIYLGAPIQ